MSCHRSGSVSCMPETTLISDNCSEYQTIHIPVNNPLIIYGEFQIYCNDPEVRFGSPDVQDSVHELR